MAMRGRRQSREEIASALNKNGKIDERIVAIVPLAASIVPPAVAIVALA